MSAPDFCGWLRKKGLKVKAYRKRWFVLRGERLYYFKAPSHKRPAGVIAIGADVTVAQDEEKDNSIKITGPGLPRCFEITADSPREMEEWITVLRGVVTKSRRARGIVVTEEDEATSIFVRGGTRDECVVEPEDFEELQVIGRGSFGKVVKVRKRDTGEIYAMKILKKEMIIAENMIEHTVAEKDILSTIDHPFIVSLYFAFQTTEKLYLVLEYLSGGELFFHLKEETRFTIEKARFYSAQIALALEHLHSHNIIYRDLKPENCVLNKEGNVTITDFGLAKTCISNATPAMTFCGTPEYLAPEILQGTGHAKAVDWWSLGILLYEMLTGLPPFYSENISEMYELILQKPLTFPKGMPPEAQSVLSGLLTRDPSKRLGGGDADAADLKSHPFYAAIDWDAMLNKRLTPPFIPSAQENYFEEEFTQEPIKQTFARPVSDVDDRHFRTFHYDSKTVPSEEE